MSQLILLTFFCVRMSTSNFNREVTFVNKTLRVLRFAPNQVAAAQRYNYVRVRHRHVQSIHASIVHSSS